MNLLPDEKVLLESVPQGLTLTTHRVRYEERRWGVEEVVSVMLDELVSCARKRRGNPNWVAGAAFFALIGQLSGQVGATILAISFAVVFLFTVRQVVELASAGATIRVNTSEMSTQAVKEFVDQVEGAKNARYLLARQVDRQ